MAGRTATIEGNPGAPAWNIKGLPADRREAIKATAHRKAMSVAEYVWALHEDAQRASQRVDLGNHTSVVTLDGATLVPADRVTHDALGGLIAAAVTVAQARRQAPRSRLLIAAERHLMARLGG